LTEPCSLLLAACYVAFPSVANKPSNTTMLELEWKVSSIPPSYLASQGPPKIATIGPTNARSVAVSSRHGLCVMDTRHRRKWKQFGTPNEERAFSVVAMSWWEGRRVRKKREDETDDLLLAIVQTNCGQQYLSCWSSKGYV
jgi:hypothetical protein